MDVQRLRNLTTGVVHTQEYHMFFDIEYLTGAIGISIKQMPDALKALKPWLRDQVDEDEFWIPEIDVSNQGQYDIQPMSSSEKNAFLKRYYQKSSNITVSGSSISISSDLLVINPCVSVYNTLNFSDPNLTPLEAQFLYHGGDTVTFPHSPIILSGLDKFIDEMEEEEKTTDFIFIDNLPEDYE